MVSLAVLLVLPSPAAATYYPAVPPPAANAPPDYRPLCQVTGWTSAACAAAIVAAINAVQVPEGAQPLTLPAGFLHWDPATQLFDLINQERLAFGLSPISGLTADLNAAAAVAAAADRDPRWPPRLASGQVLYTANGIWGADINPLSMMYTWLYDDGYGNNQDCTGIRQDGCWGHRDNLLMDWNAPFRAVGWTTPPPYHLVAGVAALPSPDYPPFISYAVVMGAAADTGSLTYTLTWPLNPPPELSLTADTPTPVSGETVTLTLNSSHMPPDPRYQFWARDPAGTWTILQDYGSASICRWVPAVPGRYHIVAYVLSAADVAHGQWRNAVASAPVRLTVTRPHPTLTGPTRVAAGTPAVLTARGSDLPPDPVWQFWIQNPTGAWTRAQGYTPSATLPLTLSRPGVYHGVAYVLGRQAAMAHDWAAATPTALVTWTVTPPDAGPAPASLAP